MPVASCTNEDIVANPQGALLSGIAHGDMERVRRAVAAGADINAPDKFGRTPLHEASFFPSLKSLDTLMELGADTYTRREPSGIHAVDAWGNTPLLIAATSAGLSPELLERYVLHWGADINARNKNRETPLLRAFSRSEFTTQLGLAFMRLGADLSARDREGHCFISMCLDDGVNLPVGMEMLVAALQRFGGKILPPPWRFLKFMEKAPYLERPLRGTFCLLYIAALSASSPGILEKTSWKTRKGAVSLMDAAGRVPFESLCVLFEHLGGEVVMEPVLAVPLFRELLRHKVRYKDRDVRWEVPAPSLPGLISALAGVFEVDPALAAESMVLWLKNTPPEVFMQVKGADELMRLAAQYAGECEKVRSPDVSFGF